MTGTAAAAARVVAEVAARLSDPDEVVRRTTVHGTHVEIDGTPAPLWTPQSLTRGYLAVALLHAELGHADPAHRFLDPAARTPEETSLYGQSEGLSAVAVALRVAAHGPADHAGILARLDDHVIANARRLITVRSGALGEPTRPVVIDVINGLAGLGRHLLGRRVAGGGGRTGRVGRTS